MASSSAHEHEHLPSIKDLPDHPRRLLIAEDEHLVATGLCSNLEELGYEVVGPVPDGQAAIELAQTEHPDLALLDIRMPKRDGFEAAEVIFKQIGIPVVMLSAYSDENYLDVANRLGVFGYLLKPVTQDQLRVTLRVAWGRFVEHVEQNGEVHDLRKRLADRKTIEQAKWILVKSKGVGEPEAMRMLQKQARNNRRNLADIARSVIENEDLFGDGDTASDD